MATLFPTLTDHDYTNWVKGGLGIKIAREGIEPFVKNNIDTFHQNVINSLSSDLLCGNCSTENVIPCKSKSIYKYNNNFCKFSKNDCKVHNSQNPSKKSKNCPNSVCHAIRDEIVDQHRYSGPSWRNTNSKLWCQEPWQLATCYMSEGYEDSSSASETDFPGLLSIVINNKVFDTVVAASLRNKNNVFCKARDSRNEILHKADMRLSDTELTKHITTFDAMLSDTKCLAGHKSAVRARALLKQLQDDSLTVSTEDADEIRAEALRAYKKELKEELLFVYQDGEHMSTPLGPLATDEDTHIEELYVDPNMKLVDHRTANENGRPVTTYQDIFKDGKKKIYIEGEAGTGKTSLCKKMVSTWCQTNTEQLVTMTASQQAMARFDYLFYISLRHAVSDDTIDEMIKHQLLANKPILQERLSSVLDEDKCVILLDGLDEWTTENRTSTSAQVNSGLPGRDAVRKCTVLTTSRPWKLESLRLKATQIDSKVKLLGIDENSSGELAMNMIEHLNDKFNCQKTYDDYITDISNKKLNNLSEIPVLLKQIVWLWHSGKQIGQTKCVIYSQMFELLLELAMPRLLEDAQYQQKKEEWTKSSIRLPICFENKTKCQNFKPLLLGLADLAFNALLSDDQESSLVFNSTEEGCHNLSPEEVNICLKIGILSQNKILIDCSSQSKKISFMHKTYQEFLAALFVAQQSATQQCVKTIQQFCSTRRKCLDMSYVLATFISVLCSSDITCALLDHFFTYIIPHNKYRHHLTIELMEEGWTCSHDNIHLYCETIHIREPSEYLDLVCKVNIPNIKRLYIFSPPTSQCLQYLLQINTIKWLFIQSPFHISEDLLYDLVNNNRNTLTRIVIEGMTLKSNAKLPALLNHVRHLKGLFLKHTTLPQPLHTALNDLHSGRRSRVVGITQATILPDSESTD